MGKIIHFPVLKLNFEPLGSNDKHFVFKAKALTITTLKQSSHCPFDLTDDTVIRGQYQSNTVYQFCCRVGFPLSSRSVYIQYS